MGNSWKGISMDQLVQAEINLIKSGGLRHEDFKMIDVKLDQDAPSDSISMDENFIHSIEIRNASIPQDQELPVMVLLHGYGAGGAVFFKILKDLSMYFHVYVVDLLGMGCSGRPQYQAFTVDLAEDFFVNSLKLWKEKVGLRKRFILAGHSLGGYISTVYTLRHPDDVEKLLLLSPVGIPEKPDTFTHEEVAQRFDTFSSRMGARVILKLWEKNYTPFGILRVSGNLGTKAFLKFYMGRRMKSITNTEELGFMKAYLHQVFLRPPSGEYALNTILSPGSWAKSPLVHRMPTIEIPVSFFYGEKDWMDPAPAYFLRDNSLLKCQIYGIEGADHHLYLDNPIDTVFKIILDVFGETEAEKYLMTKLSNDQQQQPSNIIDNGEVEEQIIT